MIEVKAPEKVPNKSGNKKIFLAGSIEMGAAENWQEKIVKKFKDSDITFINPRRDDWDSSWEQDIRNAQFYEQVTWELKGLEMADIIVLYFDAETKSPISLLELGLHARGDKMIILCPKGFWRKGNVDVVSDFYGIEQVKNMTELYKAIEDRL